MSIHASDVLDWLPHRILSFYNEANELQRGVMCRPRMAVLYPTYVCNHNCIGCDYGFEDMNLSKHPLSWTKEQGEHVIDSVTKIGVTAVEYCGAGNPDCWPHIKSNIQYAISKNLNFGILTNGTMINQIQDELVEHGSYCRITLDSACEETFNLYKRPKSESADWSRVMENIGALLRARGEYGGSRLVVSIKLTFDRNNYHDLAESFVLADKLKVDSLQFKVIRNVPSALDPSEIGILQSEIYALSKDYPELRVLGNIMPSSLEGKCWLNPVQFVVTPDGYVTQCCYYRQRPNWQETHCLGNIFKDDIEKLWFSKKHWDLIARIDTRYCNMYDCRFHHYNRLMNELVVEDVGQLHFI